MAFSDPAVQGNNAPGMRTPQSITVSIWSGLDCAEARVRVLSAARVEVADFTIFPTGQGRVDNGESQHLMSGTQDVTLDDLQCGEEVTVNFTCLSDGNEVLIQNLILACKGDPLPDECPIVEQMQISLGQNGRPITDLRDCIPTDDITATLTGHPQGAIVDWELSLAGNPSIIGTGNDITFALPATPDEAILSAIVRVANCPDVRKLLVLPPREGAECPTEMTVEVVYRGTVIENFDDLESGPYLIEVTAPLGPDATYEFVRNTDTPISGRNPFLHIMVQGGGATTTLLIRAQSSPCCPPIYRMLSFTTHGEAPDVPDDLVDEPGEPPVLTDDPAITPDSGGPNGGGNGGGNNGGWNWPNLCGILYSAMILGAFGMIVGWIWFFFAPSTAAAITTGASLTVVLAMMALLASLCSMGRCQALRVFAFVFTWCALGCFAIFWVKLGLHLFGVIPTTGDLTGPGALIAGVLCMVFGFWLQSSRCRWFQPMQLP